MTETATQASQGRLARWAQQRRLEELDTYGRARAAVLEHVPTDWVGPGELARILADKDDASSTSLLVEAMYSLADEGALECNRHGQVRQPRNGHP